MANLFRCGGGSYVGDIETIEVHYLGTGTSFNIPKLLPDIDYTTLTVNDFIVGINKVASANTNVITPQSTSNAFYSNISGMDITTNKTYNKSTGILSIPNTYMTLRTVVDGTPRSTTSVPLTYSAYLVLKTVVSGSNSGNGSGSSSGNNNSGNNIMRGTFSISQVDSVYTATVSLGFKPRFIMFSDGVYNQTIAGYGGSGNTNPIYNINSNARGGIYDEENGLNKAWYTSMSRMSTGVMNGAGGNTYTNCITVTDDGFTFSSSYFITGSVYFIAIK